MKLTTPCPSPWGDYDGDGDLDLMVGNANFSAGQPNRMYRNDHGVLFHEGEEQSTETDETTSVAWGDYDGDDDLDLIVGNVGQNRLYQNQDGILNLTWSTPEKYHHNPGCLGRLRWRRRP